MNNRWLWHRLGAILIGGSCLHASWILVNVVTRKPESAQIVACEEKQVAVSNGPGLGSETVPYIYATVSYKSGPDSREATLSEEKPEGFACGDRAERLFVSPITPSDAFFSRFSYSSSLFMSSLVLGFGCLLVMRNRALSS